MKWPLALVLLLAGTRVVAVSDAPRSAFAPDIAPLASPAARGSQDPAFARGADGAVYLVWLEPAAGRGHALKFATLDAAARRWSPARLIAQGPELETSSANFPSLVAQPGGRLTAVWSVTNPMPAAAAHAAGEHMNHDDDRHAMISRSSDGGATWSSPEPLTRESDAVAFASLLALPDGRILAAWLDGRARKSPQAAGEPVHQLYARLLPASPGTAPAGADTLLDPLVCDCCQTTLTGFPDGSALLAYRGRTAEEIRDIMVVRFDGSAWEKPQRLSRDRWKIAGCPINGPKLGSEGPRVTAAWFTAADNEPRVLLAASPDAGGLFTMPQRVDLGHPLGRVDTLILHDGSQYLTWLEGPGDDASEPAGLYLRRCATFGAPMSPVPLALSAPNAVTGFPHFALVKDFDATPAVFVAAYTREGEPGGIETELVTLPDAAVLAAADSSCACSPGGEAQAGYPLRGRITALSSAKGTIRLAHGALPGVLRAGEREFRVAPNILGALQSGREILGRVEERSGEWWIFDVRLLVRSGDDRANARTN